MRIEDNEQALLTMENYLKSGDNRFRAIYNYGYKDGYEQGLKDASQQIVDRIMKDMESDTE